MSLSLYVQEIYRVRHCESPLIPCKQVIIFKNHILLNRVFTWCGIFNNTFCRIKRAKSAFWSYRTFHKVLLLAQLVVERNLRKRKCIDSFQIETKEMEDICWCCFSYFRFPHCLHVVFVLYLVVVLLRLTRKLN